jgi:carbamoyltransferase
MNKNTGYIAAISRGHNASVCLLKDGEIIFAIEEERLSRQKYDGGPFACMAKILEYTDKIDYLVIAHTQSLAETSARVDYTGDDVYTGLARKLGLINRNEDIRNHPQVIDLSHIHHKLHAACAFYKSGFDEALAVVVDGAGTFTPVNIDGNQHVVYELESGFTCSYPAELKTVYKHLGGSGPFRSVYLEDAEFQEEKNCEIIIDEAAGITKAYEAVTQYCGWSSIEAGKTMGLFPYGKENLNIPQIYSDGGGRWRSSNRNLIIPTYPNGALVNEGKYEELTTPTDIFENNVDVTTLKSRRDMAYAVQTQSQEEVALLIEKLVKKTNAKNIVISGGYGLNCVANYFYLERLKDLNVNIYVEPVSNDAGTSIGAALLIYYTIEQSNKKTQNTSLYTGLDYSHSINDIEKLVEKYQGTIEENVTNKNIVDLLRNKNIVALFQGRSESGPRALGNRSILFDPTFADGKDFVNNVKHREYFRPFAGSILCEHANEWFDMRGLKESPHMMYAMKCRSEKEEKIPSIVHVDGTCRIQTVKKEQNLHYYELINTFYEETGIPILFNTSFNLGGEPLVETLDDALRTLKNSEIEYLYLPEFSLLVKIIN